MESSQDWAEGYTPGDVHSCAAQVGGINELGACGIDFCDKRIAGPAIAGAMIDRGWLTAWAFWAAAITLCALVLNRGAHAARDAAHRSSLERAAP